MLKFKLTAPSPLSDTGHYVSMKDYKYGSVIEGTYTSEKKIGILVSGADLVKDGACSRLITSELKYMIGRFEEVL